MSVFPVNRVPDILRRMDINSSQAEAMKTCFGILAIMSREESNKVLIAKDGMEVILNAMNIHVDRTDVQESGCDLLWSLAFNSSSVKELIAKNGGATVLVRALKRHSRSADFLKSACGALSNMCQSKLNQEGVASQGGLQPLVGAIHIHQANAKLLPFIFDAIASIIVNNEENARTVSSLGIIPVVVASLSRHKLSTEVVKSGCHTLAILSDVKGQASKIAFAGGVPIILSLLDAHSMYSDLHRVAAVVLLRMLQESTHVGREITCHEGVRILLNSLEKGGAQQDTVAAVTHILYTVTNPNSPASSAIESQLWIQNKTIGVTGASIGGSSVEENTRTKRSGSLNDIQQEAIHGNSNKALGGVVTILGQYSNRRDVVRAACRLITNLSGYPHVVQALDKLYIMDRILDCVSIHRETKDVVESTAALIKSIHRKAIPSFHGRSVGSVHGLLYIYRVKVHDEEAFIACSEMIVRLLEQSQNSTPKSHDKRKELDEQRMLEGKLWEYHSFNTASIALRNIIELDKDPEIVSLSSNSNLVKSFSNIKNNWSKTTSKVVYSALMVIQLVESSKKLKSDHSFSKECSKLMENLMSVLPSKSNDLASKIDVILSSLNSVAVRAEKIVVSPKAISMINRTNRITKNSDIVTIDDSPLEKEQIKESTELSKQVAITASEEIVQNTSSRAVDKMEKIDHGSVVAFNGEDDSGGPINIVFITNVNGIAKMFPRHPCKASRSSLGGKLLDTWPNYLERLLPSSGQFNRAFSNGVDDSAIPSRMSVAYESVKAGGGDIASKIPTPVPYQVPENGLGEPFQHSLTFDSEFESGNLLRAVQRGDASYDLFLRADLHTQGHTQWFYFAVANTHPPELVRLYEQGVQVPPVRVKFHIVNLTKPDSLFNLGMRPALYSCYDAMNKGVGWIRAGSDISYYSNSFVRGNTAGEGMSCYYTLSFTIEFQNPKDTVLIAYSYPYTYSDYKSHICKILEKSSSSNIIRKTKLCQTLSGVDCDLLVITKFKDKENKDRIGPVTVAAVDLPKDDTSGSGKLQKKNGCKSLKPALFLSARVHPGETPASWMMKGILDFLTSDTPQAKLLRQEFVIFIVPILNPDGVIYGNNRCGLAGVDLNRQWKTPSKGVHPTVYYLKSFMAAQRKLRDITMYIDLHGHSRKYNVFMYGCDDKKRPKPQVRAFPQFFATHSIGRKYVCFSDCSFHVKKGRESTARVVVAKEINIPLSFTLEATFCGANYGPLKHCHMNIGHLQEVGTALCDAFLNFSISEGMVKDKCNSPLLANFINNKAEENATRRNFESPAIDIASEFQESNLQEAQLQGHAKNADIPTTEDNNIEDDIDSGSGDDSNQGLEIESTDIQTIGISKKNIICAIGRNRSAAQQRNLLAGSSQELSFVRNSASANSSANDASCRSMLPLEFDDETVSFKPHATGGLRLVSSSGTTASSIQCEIATTNRVKTSDISFKEINFDGVRILDNFSKTNGTTKDFVQSSQER